MGIDKNLMKFNKMFIVMLMVCVLAVSVSATNIASLDFSTEEDWTQENVAMTDIEGGAMNLHDSGLVVEHIAGNVAPITTTIAYGTVTTSISGTSKCWITQNLGATQQASSDSDTAGASAGWYWQFNRKQGYYQPNANGAEIPTAIPNTWDSSKDSTACSPVVSGTEWCPNNDPCTLLLGAGWRLPTGIEWANADANGAVGGWDSAGEAYNDVLKLHSAGYLHDGSGLMWSKGTNAFYSSSTQSSVLSTCSDYWFTAGGTTYVAYGSKATGYSVRCIKDSCPISYPSSQAYYITTASGSQVDSSSWYAIQSVTTSETTPTGTSIKYLVSFDGRSTWKYWSGSAWTLSSLTNLQTNGMDKTTLEAITESQWSLGFIAGTLDFAFDLKTSDSDNTPELNGINVNYLISTLPTTSNFTSAETTNFSEVTLSSVTSMTLAITGKGKIKFPVTHSINSENEDYDTNIVIEDKVIFVNSSALHSSFNSSATLTFYNVDCNKPYVFYSEIASTFAAILSENQRCPESLCSNILCADSTLTVDVLHFTGFAAGSNANLTTEAEAGVFYPLDPIEFTAEYINSTDGTPISGECNITFDDEGTWHTMDFNSTDYNYTKSFAAAGLHEYNVTCSSANFVTLEANDTKLVSSVDIPEFSIITLGLGLIAVLGGLFVIRKKK